MNTHPTQWLGPYYDGELDADHRQRIETHLISCLECQDQLSQLAVLSEWLNKVPEAVVDQTKELFVEQVLSKLPGKATENRVNTMQLTWWAVPAILVSSWAFIQAGLFIGGLLLQINPIQLGSLDIPGAQSILHGFLSLALLPGINTLLFPAWDLLPNSNTFQLFLLNLLASSICLTLLGSWLAGWLAYRQHIQSVSI